MTIKFDFTNLERAAPISVDEFRLSDLFEQNEDNSPLDLLSVSSTLNDSIAPSTTSTPKATVMACESRDKTTSKVVIIQSLSLERQH